MREFLLSIVNPERTVLEERVVHVRLPGSEGYFGVMAGHMPFFAQLQYGVGEYRRADGVTRKFTVLGGFAEVLPDRTIVLADGAELAEEIDPDRARVALRKALEMLSQPLSEEELAEARLAVERAKARLRAIGEQV
jgi:F-type H+-transporting ATPase subunit epsilon